MTDSVTENLDTLFNSESACVTYLFRKRWPGGFICSFCGSVQKEMAPAHTVVCRYCRKQTSITAHTLMHGSKKKLVTWMHAAWQFCLHSDGLSAKHLQRLMELSSYHTAWSWLQKIRYGAGLAEATPCCGKVLFDLGILPIKVVPQKSMPDICVALELDITSTKRRALFAVLTSRSPDSIATAGEQLLCREATLFIKEPGWLLRDTLNTSYLIKSATESEVEQGQILLEKAALWLNSVYRGAFDVSYLQSYLDEFSFRYNTGSWPNRLAVFDHLVTGLLSPVHKKTQGEKS